MRINPYYILLEWNKNYPQIELKPKYEIWKSYDDTIIWDSPSYFIIGYFDSLKEAREAKKELKQ